MDDVSKMLLEDPLFSGDIKFLINQSPFRNKINYLMKEFNTLDFCDEKKRPSNCLGAVLYIVSHNETLEFIEREEMTSLLSNRYIETKVREGIVAFWQKGLLQHCAINLGTIKKNAFEERIIFHQPGHGGNFEPYAVKCYGEIYLKNEPFNITFHRTFPAIN